MKQAVNTDTHQLIQKLCMLHTYTYTTACVQVKLTKPCTALCAPFARHPDPLLQHLLPLFNGLTEALSSCPIHWTQTQKVCMYVQYTHHFGSGWNRNSQTNANSKEELGSMLLVQIRKLETDSRDLGQGHSQILKSELEQISLTWFCDLSNILWHIHMCIDNRHTYTLTEHSRYSILHKKVSIALESCHIHFTTHNDNSCSELLLFRQL